MNESAKIRDRILPLLRDKTVLDLGCGIEKIVPWAIGVDDGSEWEQVIAPDVDSPIIYQENETFNLKDLLDRDGRATRYDVVFSSHSLEHIENPIRETLEYWLSFLRENGRMILYLPDERHYVYDPEDFRHRNPAHAHFLTPEIFQWHAEQLNNVKIELIEPDIGPDRYSFLCILKLAYPV